MESLPSRPSPESATPQVWLYSSLMTAGRAWYGQCSAKKDPTITAFMLRGYMCGASADAQDACWVNVLRLD